MKYYIPVFCFAICFFISAGNVEALDKQGRYLIFGPGSNSCAAVISDLQEGVKRKSQAAVIIYSNWLAGSLTAYNRDTKITYTILGDTSFTEAFEWTLNYCKDNPNAIYSGAVDALLLEFRDDRYSSMPAAKPNASSSPADDAQ